MAKGKMDQPMNAATIKERIKLGEKGSPEEAVLADEDHSSDQTVLN
jgi:hypothetical protein